MQADEIGKMVRYHRQQSGLTQLGLAALAGVGKTVVFDIERGKESIQLKSLLRVLEVLNIQLTLCPPHSESSEGHS